jgi:hypothetical protein
MDDIVPLVSVITSGLIGAGGLAFAAWNASRDRRFRRDERDADERRNLVRQGADALAPFHTLLTKLEPDRLAVNVGPRVASHALAELRAEWEAMRNPLAVFALSHPSSRVHELATKLDVYAERVIVFGGHVVNDLLSNRDFQQMHQRLWADYREAQRILADLHDAIHGATDGATRAAETSRNETDAATTGDAT